MLRDRARVLHRDIGYFCAGMTIFYCVSGVAVNHIDAWNPSYSTSVEAVDLGPLAGTTPGELEAEVVRKAGLDADEVAGRHRPDRDRIVVFLPHGGEARIRIADGKGNIRRVTPRPFLFETNALHLNYIKGLWTYVSDAFAVLLLTLAVTGLFMLKGREGLGGRGKWLAGAGALLPIGFLVAYYVTGS